MVAAPSGGAAPVVNGLRLAISVAQRHADRFHEQADPGGSFRLHRLTFGIDGLERTHEAERLAVQWNHVQLALLCHRQGVGLQCRFATKS